MDSDDAFCVLINAEMQYSMWPTSLDVPSGWRVAKQSASKEECLTFVRENWVDLRPLSGRV